MDGKLSSNLFRKMFKKYKLLIVTCIFLSIIFGFHVFHHEDKARLSPQNIVLLQKKLALGDFIFREGLAYESLIVKQLSGSKYSHIGLITQIYPEIRIVHATTDDDKYHENQVIESSINEFISTDLANNWAIYRHTGLSKNEIHSLIKKVTAQKSKRFNIDVRGQENLYCTTLISPHLPKNVQSQLEWSAVDLPSLKGELLFPKAFFLLKDVKEIHVDSHSTRNRKNHLFQKTSKY